MITEDYCSYELSKLLKEKGFKQEGCHKSYSMEGPVAPTHQMAMKWLREKHNTHIAIDRGLEHYFVMITKMKPYQDIDMKKDVYDSFEEAVEAAIKYVLENLI